MFAVGIKSLVAPKKRTSPISNPVSSRTFARTLPNFHRIPNARPQAPMFDAHACFLRKPKERARHGEQQPLTQQRASLAQGKSFPAKQQVFFRPNPRRLNPIRTAWRIRHGSKQQPQPPLKETCPALKDQQSFPPEHRPLLLSPAMAAHGD